MQDMSKKLLRKRKGQWIIVSASILASATISQSANLTIKAEEVQNHYEDQAIYPDENVQAEAFSSEETIETPVEAVVEEPIVEEPLEVVETELITEENVNDDIEPVSETDSLNDEFVELSESVYDEPVKNDYPVEEEPTDDLSEWENIVSETELPNLEEVEEMISEDRFEEDTIIEETIEFEELEETENLSEMPDSEELILEDVPEPDEGIEESQESHSLEEGPEESVEEQTEDLPETDESVNDLEETENTAELEESEEISESSDFEEVEREDIPEIEETMEESEESDSDEELESEHSEIENAPHADSSDNLVEDEETELISEVESSELEAHAAETDSDELTYTTQTSEDTTKHYKIKRGDTLYSIARRYNVSVPDLMRWNNLSSNIIYPQSQIVVAQANNAAVTSSDDRRRFAVMSNQATTPTYGVKAGDTLYAIAQRHNVTVDQLKEWNKLSDNTIYINQNIIVSNSTNNQTSNIENETNNSTITNHSVRSGDTLYAIAQRNNVTVAQLKEWNNLSGNTIYVNQKLIVSNNNGEEQATQPETPNPEQTPTRNHSVSRGDTLWSIAQRNGVTVSQLREWNNIAGSTIHVNQQLVVSKPNGNIGGNGDTPTKPTPSPSRPSYTVNRGDTLYSIARRNNVTVNQLREWNNLSGNTIYNNQQLLVSNPNGNSTVTPPNHEENPGETISPGIGRQKVVEWFQAREGKTTYSMANRNGPYSFDCSSAVFSALIYAGYLPEGTWLGTTESLYNLEGSLLQAISRDQVQAGDIFVSGVKGQSLYSAGHTGVAVSNSQIIHSNYRDNGISTTQIEGRTGSGPTHWYRLNNAMLRS